MAYRKEKTSEYLDSKGLSDLIKNDDGNIRVFLIFMTDKVDKRKKSLMNAFKKYGAIAELNYLEDDKSCKWIAGVLGKAGITIDMPAALSVVSRCDSSMRKISSETVQGRKTAGDLLRNEVYGESSHSRGYDDASET